MDDETVQKIVTEVIRRIVPLMGADGRRGTLIAVFTGATAGFGEALKQARSLLLNGFRLQLCFSPAAEALYGATVREQLDGFPHVDAVSDHWLTDLKEARAVVVPLLSVNSLSKLTLLITGNTAANLLLHALFMGKPLIAARDGAEPESPDRAKLGFDKGAPALKAAVRERFKTAAGYGARFTPVSRLGETVLAVLGEVPGKGSSSASKPGAHAKYLDRSGDGIISAAMVRHAHGQGVDLLIRASQPVTPLAVEMAQRHGVALIRTGKP